MTLAPEAASPDGITRMRLGYQMQLDEQVPEQAESIQSGIYEDRGVRHCLRLVPDDGVFLDIGANVGHYTCAFASRLPAFRGRLIAFEPVAANIARLRANIRLNGLEGLASAHRCALGDREGELALHVLPAGEVNNAVGDNVLTDADRRDMATQGWKADKAPIHRLDDWTRGNGVARCDAIKLDVEGAEPLVLRGAMSFLARTRPAIFGEFNPYWMQQAGFGFELVRGLLEPLHYIFYIDRDGRYLPVTPQTVAQPPEVPTYLLLPKEKTGLLALLD